jgi:tetratricopeptide (TPR) repeat protein
MRDERKTACALLLVLSCACGSMGRTWFLSSNAAGIEKATKAIEAARNDGERAEAFDQRGRGYSEKARYSKFFKLISADEYDRVFGLAIKDQDQAVALAPGSAEVYLGRGLTYYNRAALEDLQGPEAKAFFASAVADFTRAIERDDRNAQALDMRGVVHTMLGDLDAAIADFTLVMPIDAHLGKLRLAEAYCERGGSYQKASNFEAAIADYERSIAYQTGGGGCDCQPESPLAWIYAETKQYDKSRDVVRRARLSGRWIAPEVIDRLLKASPPTGTSS